MRKFKLKNARGQEFDLMRKDAFFHSPTGLGFADEPQIQRMGDTFIIIRNDAEQPAPSGVMVFKGYEQWQEFRNFTRPGGLVLCYKPLDKWFYLDVTISISMDEISHENRRLVCPVQFTGTSHWYEKLTAYRTESEDNGGKTYSYTYPYTYSNGIPGTIDITNDAYPSYCRIHIMGPVTNPAFTVSQNGQRVADGRINCTVVQGRKLVIDSNPQTMEIAEYTINGQYIADRYGDSDWNTDRLIQVPSGDSRFSFTHDDVNEIIAYVEVEKRV